MRSRYDDLSEGDCGGYWRVRQRTYAVIEAWAPWVGHSRTGDDPMSRFVSRASNQDYRPIGPSRWSGPSSPWSQR